MRFSDYNRENRRAFKKDVKKTVAKKMKTVAKKIADSKSPFAFSSRALMEECCDEIEVTPDGRWQVTFQGKISELLADYYGRGGQGRRMRPWASKKQQSQELAASYHRIGESLDGTDYAMDWYKRANNTGSCAHHLEFEQHEDGSLHLVQAYFCHDPLCPVCTWRRSVKNTAILSEAMSRMIADHPDVRLIHCVLTVPNCRLDELNDTISRMHQAFSRMTKRKAWKKRVLGYYYNTEWTISKNPKMQENGRIAHPHMHVLMIVPKEYFDDVPEWQKRLADKLRAGNIDVTKYAMKCKSYADAVCAVRRILAQAILDDAERDGVDTANTHMEWTKYRHRFQRLIAHIMEIADEYRPAPGASGAEIRKAVRAFLSAVAEAGDPMYIDEPNQHVVLNMWRDAMGDPEISDVSLTAVKPKDVRDDDVHVYAGNVISPEIVAMKAAVKELCKYTNKDSDFLLPHDPDETDKRVRILREQLCGLRMNSSGGLIKGYIAAVRRDWDVKDDDLLHTGDNGQERQEEGQERDKIIVSATWSRKLHAYVVQRRVELAAGGFVDYDDWVKAITPMTPTLFRQAAMF